MLTLKSVFLTTILLKLIQFGESYIITIDARAQECFHERGPKMSKSIYFLCLLRLDLLCAKNIFSIHFYCFSSKFQLKIHTL